MTAQRRPTRQRAGRVLADARAIFNTAVLLLKVFPMLHARPVDWVTPRPIVERVHYRTSHGDAVGDLYRPDRPGPHPGIVVCLGVVPFGVEHPQVPRLGEALARSGFAALLYWSPAMRDCRLDPADVGDIASAYDELLAREDIDAARSGLLGTCVGGAFALMASSDPRIRGRVSFVLAHAPYGSMWTLAQDIASATRSALEGRDGREPWDVDPLTRRVFVHSVAALLPPEEAAGFREDYAERREVRGAPDASDDARALEPLLRAVDADAAQSALNALPLRFRRHLDALSPEAYLTGIRAPLIVLLHDRDDPIIPVAESRTLSDLLGGSRPVRYTEFTVFKHVDPTRSNPSIVALVRELFRFGRAIHPVVRSVVARRP